MADEIIIDGVDVSECIHIDNYKHCNCCNDLIKTIYPKATKCHIEEDLRCEIYSNCYFKQLKRKKQECEEINLTNERLVAEKYDLNEEILKFKNEIKEYKQALDDLMPILEHYATSNIGEKQADGTYKFVYSTNQFGNELCLNYDPRPATEGLNIIKKVKDSE